MNCPHIHIDEIERRTKVLACRPDEGFPNLDFLLARGLSYDDKQRLWRSVCGNNRIPWQRAEGTSAGGLVPDVARRSHGLERNRMLRASGTLSRGRAEALEAVRFGSSPSG